MIFALLDWLRPTRIYEPSGAHWVMALRRSGYKGSFVRIPAAAILAAGRCMQ